MYLLWIRWSPENKPKLNPYAYMPFGMGPRNCVGMRFAMEEMKIALSTVLKQFRFFPVEETLVINLSIVICVISLLEIILRL